jgi:DNA-binding Lrp family transcriptional regulator
MNYLPHAQGFVSHWGVLTRPSTKRVEYDQMVKGYLLIKLVPGLESDALSQIRATPGVVDVNLVFGQWDAVAIAEAKNLFELSRIIVSQVRGIQGVQDTTTLLEAEL